MNAITDVSGLEVGYCTLISDSRQESSNEKSVRTGVTAVIPRGKTDLEIPVFSSWFSLNGCGEMTGTAWISDSGFLFGPVMITNTYSVGIVRDAVIEWANQKGLRGIYLPVVAETWDGYLNDIFGFHVKREHVFEALQSAQTGRVAEGNVGGGTGMICYEFKGGTGTASRRVVHELGDYTLGVLVQANHGLRRELRVAGVPVGLEIAHDSVVRKNGGSIIIVIATDAPLLPHQLGRIAKRAALGLARTGSISSGGSGDLFIAFSTGNEKAYRGDKMYDVSSQKSEIADLRMLPNDALDVIFEATIQAVEEAIVNALVGAETMIGFNGHKVNAISHERLRQVMRKHDHLVGEPFDDRT
jgi:L-aminopeptidase/D-esterase-like protein